MKAKNRQKCGRLVEVSELAPAKETLASHGEIFSCGGVYLGLNREANLPNPGKIKQKPVPTYWHLPNYQKEVLVFNRGQMRRASHQAPAQDSGNFNPQGTLQTEEAIRRLFKESLN